ncbi:MAG: 3-dehydroquinate synthase [Magnetococcales bacterium]|nr:3-dehydroquinate synthase [Magnetococcales bacterium]
MPILTLDLGQRGYDIHIGSGLLAGLGGWVAPLLKQKRVGIVSNTTVAPLYLARVTAALQNHGLECLPVVLPDGEVHKNWQTLDTLFAELIRHRFERGSTLLALGGGVIGDMTGFAAASFQRGIDFIQIPTTLLAQVDSSVGGKTGINHTLGKNLIGAFHQPRLVVIDVETLTTLPKRQLAAGLAEVIKYGIIWDEGFFALLEERMDHLLALDGEWLGEIIRVSCAIKAEVVRQDEREHGVRALLNLGHTFGHALETLIGYGEILHGEAVAIGMVMAARLGERLGRHGKEEVERMRALMVRAGLPVSAPPLSKEAFFEVMGRDKKVRSGRMRFVVPQGIGRATTEADIPREEVEATLRDFGIV